MLLFLIESLGPDVQTVESRTNNCHYARCDNLRKIFSSFVLYCRSSSQAYLVNFDS